jgi:hypothetical protein
MHGTTIKTRFIVVIIIIIIITTIVITIICSHSEPRRLPVHVTAAFKTCPFASWATEVQSVLITFDVLIGKYNSFWCL